MKFLFTLFAIGFLTSVLRFAETLNLLWAGGAIVSLALMLACGTEIDNHR